MAYIRCGSGSTKEIHGAVILVETTESSLIGLPVTLSLNSVAVSSKAMPLSGICMFSDIMSDGEYTVSCDDVTVKITISAEDIIGRATKEVEINKKLYLYNTGDECIDITGGWSADDYGDLIKYDTELKISKKYETYSAILSHKNLINVDGHNTLKAEIHGTNTSYNITLLMVDDRDWMVGNDVKTSSADYTEVSLPIPNGTNLIKVKLAVLSNGGIRSALMRRCWLEK